MAIVAVISFALIHTAPGDAAYMLFSPQTSVAEIEALRHELGLDRPVVVQFADWVTDFARGDFGTGLLSKQPVTQLMKPRLEATISLTLWGMFFSIVMGIPLGMLAAWKAHTLIDRAVMLVAVFGLSVPSFWLAFIFVWAFALKLSIFPAIGYNSISEGLWPWMQSLIMPCFVISLHSGAVYARMTRSTMLEVLQEDYVRTARAKGLAEMKIFVRHAFKNASIPIITLLGFLFIGLITGTIFVEIVFAIPGLGRLLVDAVNARDVPIVQALLMLTALVYVYVNLVVDIIYAYVDPRIRY
jgi:peptide/nickel transport system permease protein